MLESGHDRQAPFGRHGCPGYRNAFLLVLATMLLAVAPRIAHAQASAPGSQPSASAIPADPGQPRDFEAERKAISDSRAWTNYRFSVAERACYSKFLVNHCIEKAKDAQREELHVLRAKDLEIGDAERAYKAAKRDREQAIRRAEYEAGQPGRAANEQASREAFDRKQQEQALRDAQANAQAPQRAANAEAYQKKQDDFNARMNEAQQKGPSRRASGRKCQGVPAEAGRCRATPEGSGRAPCPRCGKAERGPGFDAESVRILSRPPGQARPYRRRR